jgi:hypothetical protein
MKTRSVLAARAAAAASMCFIPLASVGCVGDITTEPEPDDIDVTAEPLQRGLSWEMDFQEAPADAPSIAATGEQGGPVFLVLRRGCAILSQAKTNGEWQIEHTLAEDNACKAAPIAAMNAEGVVGVQWVGDAFDPTADPSLQQPSEAVVRLASVDAEGAVSEAPAGFGGTLSAASTAVTEQGSVVSLWNFGHRYGGFVNAAVVSEASTARENWAGNGSSLSDVQVAAEASGGAVAVWFASQGRPTPYSRRFDPATGWQDIQQLGGITNGFQAFSMAPGGESGLMVWGDSTAGKVITRAYRGGVWASKLNPLVLGKEDVGGLALANNDQDRAALLYLTNFDRTLHAIGGLRDKWSKSQQIDSTTAGTIKTPAVAMDAAGNAFAVWVRASADGSSDEIWGAYALVGKAWQPAVRIGQQGLGSSLAPQLAVIGPQDVFAAWSQVAAGDGTSAVFVAHLH